LKEKGIGVEPFIALMRSL